MSLAWNSAEVSGPPPGIRVAIAYGNPESPEVDVNWIRPGTFNWARSVPGAVLYWAHIDPPRSKPR